MYNACIAGRGRYIEMYYLYLYLYINLSISLLRFSSFFFFFLCIDTGAGSLTSPHESERKQSVKAQFHGMIYSLYYFYLYDNKHDSEEISLAAK